jgi:hypothetical protein
MEPEWVYLISRLVLLFEFDSSASGLGLCRLGTGVQELLTFWFYSLNTTLNRLECGTIVGICSGELVGEEIACLCCQSPAPSLGTTNKKRMRRRYCTWKVWREQGTIRWSSSLKGASRQDAFDSWRNSHSATGIDEYLLTFLEAVLERNSIAKKRTDPEYGEVASYWLANYVKASVINHDLVSKTGREGRQGDGWTGHQG